MTRAESVAVVAAILLPPLGVFLDQGITPNFWMAALFTIFFFFPGMLFAMFTVLRPKPAPSPA